MRKNQFNKIFNSSTKTLKLTFQKLKKSKKNHSQTAIGKKSKNLQIFSFLADDTQTKFRKILKPNEKETDHIQGLHEHFFFKINVSLFKHQIHFKIENLSQRTSKNHTNIFKFIPKKNVVYLNKDILW